MKKAITAMTLAAALAMPMAAVTATSAASWGVVTKWWESSGKNSGFGRVVRGSVSGECYKKLFTKGDVKGDC